LTVLHLQTTGKGVAFVSAVEHLIGAERQRMDRIHWLKLRMRKDWSLGDSNWKLEIA
jgi:hypothetical protein